MNHKPTYPAYRKKHLDLRKVIELISDGELANIYTSLREHKKSLIVETALIKFPLRHVVVDCRTDIHKIVIGRDQLGSLVSYMKCEFSLCLPNPVFTTRFDGLYFDQLPHSLQRRLGETDITFVNIYRGTDEFINSLLMRY